MSTHVVFNSPMSNHEVATATINRSAVVHYVYNFDGHTYSLCNGERMSYQRIARPTSDAATCKRCVKSNAR